MIEYVNFQNDVRFIADDRINKNEAKKVTREVGQILEEKFGVWTA